MPFNFRRPTPPANQNHKWYRIENATTTEEESETSAEIYLYGGIGSWYGVDAATFVRELAALDVDRIDMYVNSPGGDVYDGIAILNAVRRHKARVVVHIDALAASAASYIAMGGDEIIMGRQSEMMIHDAWGYAMGDAREFRDYADFLDRLSASIAGIYAERAGGDPDTWREAMLAETWYTAEEAVAAGLADSVDESDAAEPVIADPDSDETEDPETEDPETDTDEPADVFDLSVFAHRGRRAAPAPNLAAAAAHVRRTRLSLSAAGALARAVHEVASAASTKPPAEPVEHHNPQTKGAPAMSDALTQGLRERLGIPADAVLTDDGLLAAVDEVLTEQATPTTTAAPAVPSGTVMLDEAQYTELTQAAQMGREARERQIVDDRTALVQAAVADGRIPPARRQHWLDLLTADAGAAATLASLTPGTVPLKPAGYTGGIDQASDEDITYSKFWNDTPKTKEG